MRAAAVRGPRVRRAARSSPPPKTNWPNFLYDNFYVVFFLFLFTKKSATRRCKQKVITPALSEWRYARFVRPLRNEQYKWIILFTKETVISAVVFGIDRIYSWPFSKCGWTTSSWAVRLNEKSTIMGNMASTSNATEHTYSSKLKHGMRQIINVYTRQFHLYNENSGSKPAYLHNFLHGMCKTDMHTSVDCTTNNNNLFAILK